MGPTSVHANWRCGPQSPATARAAGWPRPRSTGCWCTEASARSMGRSTGGGATNGCSWRSTRRPQTRSGPNGTCALWPRRGPGRRALFRRTRPSRCWSVGSGGGGGGRVAVSPRGPAGVGGRRLASVGGTDVEPQGGLGGPLPGLPEGARLAPAGDGVAGVAPAGRTVTWVPRPMSADEPVLIGWNDEQGAPRVEGIEVAGAPAALVESTATGTRWLVLPAGPDRGWLVTGSLPREDLLRVAASLPKAC